LTMMSLAMTPALAAGVSSIGATTVRATFHSYLDAEATELAASLRLYLAEAIWIHIARMWIEPGEHAVDRRFDELVVVRFLDVIGYASVMPL
jgi:hypothetical protein